MYGWKGIETFSITASGKYTPFSLLNYSYRRRIYSMSIKIYVGHLPTDTTSTELSELFAASGTVVSAEVVNDRETGMSRGFGFVQMASDDDASKAIRALNGYEHKGRSLTVNEARAKERR